MIVVLIQQLCPIKILQVYLEYIWFLFLLALIGYYDMDQASFLPSACILDQYLYHMCDEYRCYCCDYCLCCVVYFSCFSFFICLCYLSPDQSLLCFVLYRFLCCGGSVDRALFYSFVELLLFYLCLLVCTDISWLFDTHVNIFEYGDVHSVSLIDMLRNTASSEKYSEHLLSCGYLGLKFVLLYVRACIDTIIALSQFIRMVINTSHSIKGEYGLDEHVNNVQFLLSGLFIKNSFLYNGKLLVLCHRHLWLFDHKFIYMVFDGIHCLFLTHYSCICHAGCICFWHIFCQLTVVLVIRLYFWFCLSLLLSCIG